MSSEHHKHREITDEEIPLYLKILLTGFAYQDNDTEENKRAFDLAVQAVLEFEATLPELAKPEKKKKKEKKHKNKGKHKKD